MSSLKIKTLITYILLFLLVFFMTSCASSNESLSSDQKDITVQAPENVQESYETVLAPVKQYDENGFVAYKLSRFANAADEDKNILIYYDFSTMKYTEISTDGVSRKSTEDSSFLDFGPVLINNKIYLFQQRYYGYGVINEIYTDLENRVFIYDLNTGKSETITLPEEYYFQNIQRNGITDGNVILVSGCTVSDNDKLQDCIFEIDLQKLSVSIVLNSEKSDYYIPTRREGEYYIFTSLNGDKEYKYKAAPQNDNGVVNTLYQVNIAAGETKIINDDIYPGDYGVGLIYLFVSDGDFIYYVGIDSINHCIANFVVETSSGDVTMINEKRITEQDQSFYWVYGVTEDKLIMSNKFETSMSFMDPGSFALVDKSDYLSGVYELTFFTEE